MAESSSGPGEHLPFPCNHPEPSPFAAFAERKRSALEIVREHQRQSRRFRRHVCQVSAGLLLGVAVPTATALSLCKGVHVFPTALAGSAIGSILGLLAGLSLACVCFGFMLFSGGSTYKRTFESQLARSNPTALMTALAALFGFIGLFLGAIMGSAWGASWVCVDRIPEPLGMATLIAVWVGPLLSLFAWLLWTRIKGPAEGAEAHGPPEGTVSTSPILDEVVEPVSESALLLPPFVASSGEPPQKDFAWNQLAPSDAQYEFAQGLLSEGQRISKVAQRLREQGLSDDFVATIVARLAEDRARHWLAFLPKRTVRQRLVEQGLTPDDAAAVASSAVCQRQHLLRKVGVKSRWSTALQVSGGCIILSGVVIAFGNVSGLFPTIPYAGSLLMLPGFLLWFIGKWMP